MNNLGLVIKREFLHRVSKKSFILLTLLSPFLFAALFFVPLWLASFKGGDTHQVAVIDNTGKYAPLFQDTESYHFINGNKSLEQYKDAPDKEILAFISITGDLLTNPNAASIYSKKQVPSDLKRLVNMTLTKQIESDKLATFNIPNLKEIIEESKIDFSIQSFKWGDDGSENISSSAITSIIGMVFTLMIYMFVLAYGMMVMQGVMEEKSNRIIELMISSVKPFDLMLGKIIGVGFVGLTQVFLWGIMTSVLTMVGILIWGGGMEALQSGMLANTPSTGLAENALSQQAGLEWIGVLETINFGEIGLMFVIYFIGGYILYSSIFSAIGAAVESQEDTQQFLIPIMAFMVFGLYAGIYSMENQDGPLAFWCSIFPFTSPIVMMVRVPFDVPLWEKVLSIAILYGSAIGLVWFSGKIYRVGILMYGKKPSVKELIKWIRYK